MLIPNGKSVPNFASNADIRYLLPSQKTNPAYRCFEEVRNVSAQYLTLEVTALFLTSMCGL